MPTRATNRETECATLGIMVKNKIAVGIAAFMTMPIQHRTIMVVGTDEKPCHTSATIETKTNAILSMQ